MALWFEDPAPVASDLARVSRGMRMAAAELHLDLTNLAYVAGVANRDQLDASRQVQQELAYVSDGVQGLVGITAELLAVAGRELGAIKSVLTTSDQTLVSVEGRLARIEVLLASPAATAGREMREQGLYALRNGWADDAIRDLKDAVARSPYDPLCWWGLAAAQEASALLADAGYAYARGAKYASPGAPATAIALALLGAAVLERAGLTKDAVNVCREIAATTPPSASLLLALARLSGEVDALVSALEINPALVVEAKYAGLLVDDAALAADADYRAKIDILRPAAEHATIAAANLEVPVPLMPQPEPGGEPAEQLVRHASELQTLRQHSQSIIESLRQVLSHEPQPPGELEPFNFPTPAIPTPPKGILGATGKQRVAYESARDYYETRLADRAYEQERWNHRAKEHAAASTGHQRLFDLYVAAKDAQRQLIDAIAVSAPKLGLVPTFPAA